MRYILRYHPSFKAQVDYDLEQESRRILAEYYEKIKGSEHEVRSFHDHIFQNTQHFIDSMKDPMMSFYTSHDADNRYEVVGHCHMTGFYGKVAMAHFGVAPESAKGWTPIRMMKDGLAQIWDFDAYVMENGEPKVIGKMVHQLVGITPVEFKGVVAVLKRVGWKIVDTLREASYDIRRDKYLDSYLSIIHR